jgi:chemotaxis protein MotB
LNTLAVIKTAIMKKQVIKLLLVASVPVLMTSCVAKKKFVAAQNQISSLQTDSARLEQKIAGLQADVAGLQQNIAALNQKMDASNRAAAGTIASQKDALQRSEQELADRQRRLESLQSLLEQQKKNADALRQKMADALVKFNSNELSVSVKNGKVYVSLQENLLFPSGSATVNAKGKEALGKLAEVLNANQDITVNIEGHTDSIPIRTRFEDNWALSTARATSIVRILTKDYQVDPVRVVASGHSLYDPVDSNTNPDGRAKNRRTEIILSPKLDELYKLING